jgi:hypothetical protein
MKEKGRPKATPIPSTRKLSVRTDGRWCDDPRELTDDELMLVVRSMRAVDRAVDGFRGRRSA